MTKEREYRAYAGTCVDLANKATNDEDKKHLLAMAEAWLGLADRVSAQSPNPTRVRCIQRFGQSLGGCLRGAALRGLVAIRLLDPLARHAARSMPTLNPPAAGPLRAER